MSAKQKMCTVMDLPTSILASLFAPLMFAGLPNHFPILTMIPTDVFQLYSVVLRSHVEGLFYLPHDRWAIERFYPLHWDFHKR